MSDALTVDLTDDPAPEDLRTVGRGLNAFNRAYLGDDDHRPLAVFLRDAHGAVRGGLIGDTAYGWLYVDVLWLEESLRGDGWGSRLLAEAERGAMARGCTRAYLDTTTFQAPAFYASHGYVEVGRITDFRFGFDLVYLTKNLTPFLEG